MLLSNVNVEEPLMVAALLKTAVHTDETNEAETTLVFAGIPVPVTVRPAPIATIVVANVTLVVLFKVAAAVKTPTALTVVPVNEPKNGRVFTEEEISLRFCPG
jgi:hypothetical protein